MAVVARTGCQRCWAAAVLFVLLLQLSEAQFSYMIGPASYLDVVKPPDGSSSADRYRPRDYRKGGEVVPAVDQTPLSTQGDAAARTLLQASTRYTKPYSICVSDWVPRYQVELFRMLAKEVGWEDGDYAFTCMKHNDMMADLQDPAGNCSLSAAGVEVSLENLASNLKFSWPTYKSGLRIMIHAELQHGSTWAFSEVFHWTVWLALGGTAIVVGLLVGFIEWFTPDRAGEKESKKGWQSWSWYSLAKLVHVISHVGDPAADASRILMLGYGFLVLVMVSMYTATSASRITAEKLVHPVHGKKDLVGRKVGTWSKYVAALHDHHHIEAEGQHWETEADKEEMIAKLIDHTHDALVLDAPVLEYTVGTNEHCDLFTVGEPFETFSLALAFPADYNDSTVFAFSASIVKLQTYQGALDMLENVYVKTGGTSKCFSSGGDGHGTGKMIQLYQVSGLWYILLITIGLCFILTIIHNFRKDPKKMLMLKTVAMRVRRASSNIGALPPEGAPALGSGEGAPSKNSAAGPAGSTPWPSAPASHSASPGGSQPGGVAAEPSALKMFLGVSTFSYREDDHDEHDSEDEGSLPGSPKRKPHSPLKGPTRLFGTADKRPSE